MAATALDFQRELRELRTTVDSLAGWLDDPKVKLTDPERGAIAARLEVLSGRLRKMAGRLSTDLVAS
jgi:hypothetical protein